MYTFANEAKERLINPKTQFLWLLMNGYGTLICVRSFISFTFSSMRSFIWYDRLALSLSICIQLHFCSLKRNCHIVDQFTKRLISSCNDVVSSSVLILRYNFVSSANIDIVVRHHVINNIISYD